MSDPQVPRPEIKVDEPPHTAGKGVATGLLSGLGCVMAAGGGLFVIVGGILLLVAMGTIRGCEDDAAPLVGPEPALRLIAPAR